VSPSNCTSVTSTIVYIRDAQPLGQIRPPNVLNPALGAG